MAGMNIAILLGATGAGLCGCLVLLWIAFVASSKARARRAPARQTPRTPAGPARQTTSTPAGQSTQRPKKPKIVDTTVIRGSGSTKSGGPTPCPPWIAKNAMPLAIADTEAMVQRARTMGKVNVAFIGDSITNQLNTFSKMGAYAATLGSKGKVAILGVGGDTIETAMWRLCQPNAFPQADVYVICLGTNNITAQSAAIVEKLQVLLDYIRSRNKKADLVFLGCFWRGEAPGRFEQIKALNREIKAMVQKADGRVHYADWPETLTSQADFVDGVHPNEGGWDKVMTRLFPYLDSLLN